MSYIAENMKVVDDRVVFEINVETQAAGAAQAAARRAVEAAGEAENVKSQVELDRVAVSTDRSAVELARADVEEKTGVVLGAAENVTGAIVETKETIGIDVIPEGQNIAPEFVNINLYDRSLWVVGRISANHGGVNVNATGFVSSFRFIPVYPGKTYRTNIWLRGETISLLAFYDANQAYVDYLTNRGDGYGTTFYDVEIPNNVAFIRYTLPLTSSGLFDSPFSPKFDINVPTSRVFATPALVTEKSIENARLEIIDKLDRIGFSPTLPGKNFIEGMESIPSIDRDHWIPGFLKSDGTIQNDSGFVTSVKSFPVMQGDYLMTSALGGNSRWVLFDQNGNVLQDYSNGTGSIADRVINIPVNGYIRISHRLSAPLSGIKLINEEIVYPKAEIDVKGFIRNILIKSFSPKKRISIVSFISDDGSSQEKIWYLPTMRAKGVRSTLAIITGRMGQTSATIPPIELIELSKEGFELAGHTHLHRRTANLTIEEYEDDMIKCKTILSSMNESAPMFISPFGENSTTLDRVKRKYFKADFITGGDTRVLNGTCVNLPPIDPYRINRVSFDTGADDGGYFNVDGYSKLDICKMAVDQCLEQKGWLVFVTHPNYNEYKPDTNPDGFEQRRQDLVDLIDYIQSKEIPILTAGQAFEIWKNPVQIGLGRLDGNYFALGMDGTETGNLLS